MKPIDCANERVKQMTYAPLFTSLMVALYLIMLALWLLMIVSNLRDIARLRKRIRERDKHLSTSDTSFVDARNIITIVRNSDIPEQHFPRNTSRYLMFESDLDRSKNAIRYFVNNQEVTIEEYEASFKRTKS